MNLVIVSSHPSFLSGDDRVKYLAVGSWLSLNFFFFFSNIFETHEEGDNFIKLLLKTKCALQVFLVLCFRNRE